MIKRTLLLLMILAMGTAYATPVEITPVHKISTTTKHFSVGNKYQFKDTKTGELYTGEITFYRPNGMTGQEAQVEISNFINSEGTRIPGKITLIPSNHTVYQEFANHFESSCPSFIRGSEIILKPGKQKFLINISETPSKMYSIKLIPAEPISTVHDELEVGDTIRFRTANDVYKNGQLYIKKGTPVLAEIDYIDENGWIGDNATIILKTFSTEDINGNQITLTSDLTINGFELLKYKSKRFAQFFSYISSPFRGKEIDIKSYDKNISFVILAD